MGRTVFAALCPHAPVLMEEIGGRSQRRVQKTVQALNTLQERFAATRPDTVIVFSPHLRRTLEPVVLAETILEGHFGDFRHPDLSYSFEADTTFVQSLLSRVPLTQVYGSLDYATLVPLHFLCQGFSPKLVSLGITVPTQKQAQQLGESIAETIRDQGGGFALIASGDLSHRLFSHAPGGYHPDGPKFDELFLDLLSRGDVDGLWCLDEPLVRNAGQCALGPVWVLLACLRELFCRGEVLSYEGPFGVGYGVVDFLLKGGP